MTNHCVSLVRLSYAVNTLARISLVRVLAEILALCDVQGLSRDDLVECVGGAGEEFACVAMAMTIISTKSINDCVLQHITEIIE